MKLRKSSSPKADVAGHRRGIHQGNARGNYERQTGFLPDGRVTAESATGVNAGKRNPIDPRMPNLPPA